MVLVNGLFNSMEGVVLRPYSFQSVVEVPYVFLLRSVVHWIVLSVLQAAIPRCVEVGAHQMSKRGH